MFVSRLRSRPGSFATSPEPPIWSAAQRERVPHARNEADRSGHGDERNGTDERTHDIPPSGLDETLDGDEGDEREHEKGAEHDQHAEQPPVRDAIRPRGAVLDESGSRERPARDDDPGDGGKEPEQRGLDTALGQPERQGDDDHRGDQARARLRQQDHDRGRVEQQGASRPAEALADRDEEPEAEPERRVREESEGIPVADRSLQARDAAHVVGAERRNRLAEQGPGEDCAERHGEQERKRSQRPAGKDAGGEADDSEGEHDDAVRESVPGAVAGDRPPDAEARPGDETDRGGGCHEAGAVESRERDAPARPADDESRRHEHRGRSEGCRRVGAGGAAGEESPRDEDGNCCKDEGDEA